MVVGYVYSFEGSYLPDRVEVSLLANQEVYRGEYLCIRHPTLHSKHVFLQVETAYIRRPSASYEEKLIRDGIIRHDPEKITAKAVCWQVGYDDNGTIRPLLTPIPPLTPVYRPSEQALTSFLTADGPSITVGKMYPSGIPISLSLKPLFRQGLLVVGGVGTGKSTLLLSLIINILRGLNGVARFLLVDWDGEYNAESLERAAEEAGGYARITASTKLSRRKTKLSPREWYDRFRRLSGKSGNEKSMRTLYAVLRQEEEAGVAAVEWSVEAFQNILEKIHLAEARQELEGLRDVVFKADGDGEGADIISLIRGNALVHMDFSDAENWDEIINKTAEALHECYLEARSNASFGVIVVMDEAHNFAPQSVHEGAASREAYEKMIPLMKLVATTGPRNGMPLFIATQRLSELDKFISTQMGQNIFAFRVEDVDLERLRNIMGSDIAYTARYLPRGYCLFKGHALKIQRPVILSVEKMGDVASVGKDLLTRLQNLLAK
ncbi:MAG: DUF87 domain-containing protein [Candidatus Caldarchaeum sp.]